MKLKRMPLEVKALLISFFWGGLVFLLACISDRTLGMLLADYQKVTERDVNSLMIMRSIVRNSAEWRQQLMLLTFTPGEPDAARLAQLEASAGMNDRNFELLQGVWTGSALSADIEALIVARRNYREEAGTYLKVLKSGGVLGPIFVEYEQVERVYQDYLRLQDNVTALIEADMNNKMDHIAGRLGVVRWVVRVLGSWPVLAVAGTLMWAVGGVAWALLRSQPARGRGAAGNRAA